MKKTVLDFSFGKLVPKMVVLFAVFLELLAIFHFLVFFCCRFLVSREFLPFFSAVYFNLPYFAVFFCDMFFLM